jgi:hypothetical protein
MKKLIRPLLLTAIVAGVIINLHDIVRYMKIKMM